MKRNITHPSKLELANLERHWLHDIQHSLVKGEMLVVKGGVTKAFSLTGDGHLEIRERVELEEPMTIFNLEHVGGDPLNMDPMLQDKSGTAKQPGTVLDISLDAVVARSRADQEFREQLFQELGTADSLRYYPVKCTPLLDDGKTAEEDATWQILSFHLDQLKNFLHGMDRRSLANNGVVFASDLKVLRNAFRKFEVELNERLGNRSKLSKTCRDRLGDRLQQEILPYMLLSTNGGRWYAKPRGYAGDFRTIAMIYENSPHGHSRLGAALDRCFMDVHAAQAVRNRRSLLVREIHATIMERQAGSPATITSLACGPAQEVFDVYDTLEDPAVLQCTLLDVDLQALADVAKERDRRKLRKQIDLTNQNLIHLAKGIRSIGLKDQDLIYSIGLIDYFEDHFVVALLDFVHKALRPGGRVILGNFHPNNPSKAFMDYILDWRLIHRDEDDMNRLFSKSAFGKPCTRFQYEAQNINLFGECVR